MRNPCFRITFRSHPLTQAFIRTLLLPALISLFCFPPQYIHAQLAAKPVFTQPFTTIQPNQSFMPAVLKGVQIIPDNPLRFNFYIDSGSQRLEGDPLKKESTKLIKYFLAALTIPDQDLWVNLSPYEKDRIISDQLAVTEMGAEMLGEDYVLKQLSASLTYPEEGVGKKFWEQIYTQVSQIHGVTEIPLNTFNKIWIVPEKAVVYESQDAGFVVNARLKVLMEEDYLALKENLKNNEIGIDTIDIDKVKQLSSVSSTTFKEMILPEIEKEINDGEEFASLRQIYYSLILATWYKRNLQKTLLARMYVGKNKTEGIETDDREVKQRVYEQYLAAFKDGVYNYIKEEYDPMAQEVISRRYFSGGLSMGTELDRVYTVASDPGEVRADGAMTSVIVNLIPQRLKEVWQKFTRKQTDTAPEEATPPVQVALAQPVTHGPSHDVVKRSKSAFEYADQQQNFIGVDLEHFVHAQKRLSNHRLAPETLRQMLEQLGLDTNLSGAAAYQSIYKTLAQGKYTKDILDLINNEPGGLSTYADPRLNVSIEHQNINPRAQSINEAVANAIDAILGLSGENVTGIGQFGMGIKQLLDWLASNGQDRIDVVTRQNNIGNWQHLVILKDNQGQYYIQIQTTNDTGYQKFIGTAPMFSTGTAVRIGIQQVIPEQSDEPEHTTQRSLAENVHTRFAYWPGVDIVTHIFSQEEKVNGKEHRSVVMGPVMPELDIKGHVHLLFTNHSITIVDSGRGMDEENISRMFVPREGTKSAVDLSLTDVVREKEEKVRVIHDPTLPHRVSFGRNFVVIRAFDIPDDISRRATVEGGLMLEFGRLLEVPESNTEIRANASADFQSAVEFMIEEIRGMNISADERLRYINTIIIGLELQSKGNPTYESITRDIINKTQVQLRDLVHDLKSEGYVFLPHDRQFEKLQIPSDKKVIFLHEGLFNFQGAFSLKELGAETIQGIRIGGDKNLPLVVASFTDESLAPVAEFYERWHTLDEGQRMPVIKTDRFVAIPRQFGAELLRLANKRLKEPLTEKETRDFKSLAELVNIAVGDQVSTSYEVTAVKKQMHVATMEEMKRSDGEIDSPQVNRFGEFASRPPFVTEAGSAASAAPKSAVSQVPSDANQKYVLAGSEVKNLETGKAVLKDVVGFQPLSHGFYEIIQHSTDVYGNPEKKQMIVRFKGDESEKIHRFNADEVKITYSSHKKIAIAKNSDGGILIIMLDTNDYARLNSNTDSTLQKFYNSQVSHDERYVAYLADDTNADTFLIVFDIEQNKIIRKLLVDTSAQYAFHPEANVVYVSDGDASDNIAIIDIASNNLSYAKQIHTDSSGTYTAFINSDEEMLIQVHGSSEWISAGTLGVDSIEGIRTLWKDGKPLYEITVKIQGRSKIYSFDLQGMRYEFTALEYDYFEEFTNDGTLFYVDNMNRTNQFDPDHIDPLQRRGFLYPHVYKDPHSDLLLDFIEVNRPNAVYRAIDLKTGVIFRLSGQLVRYVPALKMVLTRTEEGNLVENFEEVNININRYVAIDGPLPRFGVLQNLFKAVSPRLGVFQNQIKKASSYMLMDFETGTKIDLQVTTDVYKKVSFDGKYFVFTNPQTGETVYLNPENPSQPASVSTQPKSPASSAFSKTKPADAPGRWVVSLTPDGKYKIIDSQGTIIHEHIYERVERVNDDVFIGYALNGHLISILKNGSMIFNLPIDAPYIIHSYHRNWIIIERPNVEGRIARFIFDLKTERTYPDWEKAIASSKSGNFIEVFKHADESSLDVKFSSSGRFSVHELRNGKLVFYDHTTSDFQPTEILQLAEGDEYLVHPNADVVIVKEKSSVKYRLFNLLNISEPAWSQELYDHVEVDSTGTIAIVKIDSEIGWINLKKRGDVPGQPATGLPLMVAFVRVSSDNQFVYVYYKFETKKIRQNLLKFDKTTGEVVTNIIFFDAEGVKTPRFWEQYDADKKTIYDRDTDGKPANWPNDIIIEFPYPERPSTVPPWLQLENNNVIIDTGVDLHDGWSPIGKLIIDIQTGQEFLLSIDGDIKFFEGRQVAYVRTISDGYKINSFRTNQWIDADQLLVNDSQTFMLAIQKNPGGQSTIFVMNSAGEMTDINTLIPEGFVPTGVNGEYFTFANPQTGDVIYFDPSKVNLASAVAKPQTAEAVIPSATMEQWKADVTAHTKEWLALAQSAHKPIVGRIHKEYPEYEDAVREELNSAETSRALDAVYAAQQKEISARFEAAFKTKQPFDQTSAMPFDHVASRSQQLQSALEAYLALLANEPYVSQEEFQVRKNYFAEIFSGTVNLGINLDIDITRTEDQPFTGIFEVLGHGWEIKSQEAFDLAPVIAAFIRQIKDSYREAKMRDVRRIVKFLSDAMSRNPTEDGKIIRIQLGKILKLTPKTRGEFLQRMVKALSEIEGSVLSAYLVNPDGSHDLQDARPFVIFLTREVNPVREESPEEQKRFVPDGDDQALPDGSVSMIQLAELEEQRVKKEGEGTVMTTDYFEQHLNQLPAASEKVRLDILRDIRVRAEAGAYTGQVVQNSSDAKATVLTVDFFIHTNEQGQKEYVEQMTDNGTGALEEMALLLRRISPKAGGNQELTGGFFGTGKMTLFEGVDRVEFITKNGLGRAYMFTVNVIRDETGKPADLRVTRYRKITDKFLSQGVTVRRIKAVDDTIPELDQILAQRNWKVFTGLAQRNDFKIYLVDHEGKKQPLVVEHEVLSESDFIAIPPGQTQSKNFGKFKLTATKDLPQQVRGALGIRLSEMNEKYLALVPSTLRRHLKEFGINIQIPLPEIEGRDGFAHEQDYLETIQKYAAVELYKVMAYKVLTQNKPQFVFEGFPQDWETNNHYWNSIDVSDKNIVQLAKRINTGDYQGISAQDLQALLTVPGRADFEKLAVKLILMLEIDTRTTEGRSSLLGRRIAIQERIDVQRAARERAYLQSRGIRDIRAPAPETILDFSERIRQGLGIFQAHEQMRKPENLVIPLKDYRVGEKEFIAYALSAGKIVGVENVLLVNPLAAFAGAFRMYQGKRTMFINRSVAQRWGVEKESLAIIDEGSNTVVHELAHTLEKMALNFRSEELWKDGYIAHDSNFTHAAIGTFGEAMKYMASVWLMKQSGIVTPVAQSFRDEMMKREDRPDAAAVDSAMYPSESTVTADSATLSQSQPVVKKEDVTRPKDVGGIDFNPAALQIETQGAGIGFKLPYNFQELESMPIGGFSPVILQMSPVTSLPLILGQRNTPSPELSLAQ